MHNLSNNNEHKLGLINLNIEQWSDESKAQFSIEAIRDEEDKFIKTIEAILSK